MKNERLKRAKNLCLDIKITPMKPMMNKIFIK